MRQYIDTHEETNEAKLLKRNMYNGLALRTFLFGLKEPLGTTNGVCGPEFLSEALQFVIQENNIHYFQN